MAGVVRPRIWFPEMELVLVRRASARLPRNNFIFRTEPKYTKLEIKEYLQKLYGVKVQRIATINYAGKLRRIGSRKVIKLKDYKKVYVTISDEAPEPPPAVNYDPAPSSMDTER